MRLWRLGRDAQQMRTPGCPRFEASPLAWNDTVVESAVLAHVVNERFGGASTSELALSLDLDFEVAERAVKALTGLGLLHRDGSKLVAGPGRVDRAKDKNFCRQ